MSPLTHSRCKIILFIFAIVLIWQTVKFLPGLQFLQSSEYKKTTAFTPVYVTVYYEALCPDSKNFIVKHLLPTVSKASKLVNVSLVPYGKAETKEKGGNLFFSCQHGPIECIANKIHACAISKVKESNLQIKYISCMISDNAVPELIGEKCAKDLSINWQSIMECATSDESSNLLSEYGKMTDLLSPKMSFVPTVLLNHKHGNQAAILKDFFKEVCALLNYKPEECS